MRITMAFIAGLIFGIGLIVAGMTDPSKVIGFLDFSGIWDPSLAFVMGGAILVGSVAFYYARGRSKAWLGDTLRLPTAKQIDKRLVLGALAFGVGWGLAGYCPGPAIASLVVGGSKPALFVVAMLGGMLIYEVQDRMAARRKQLSA